uniref:Ig-like domain-containing protein n=1 Tax=Fundulus heteroclitus TaxID=8078 RepID=A0A3Q2QPV1_FUNHE
HTHWLHNLLLVALLHTWLRSGDSVKQTEGHAVAAQGDNATLQCTFETNSFANPYLFWYKQEKNKNLRHILTRVRGTGMNSELFNKDRFDADLQDTSISLTIQDLQLSDSAVYYCALQPTVTGNTRTLYKNLAPKTCCFTSFCFYLTLEVS